MVRELSEGEARDLVKESVNYFGTWDIVPAYSLFIGVGEIRNILLGKNYSIREISREEYILGIPVWRFSLAKKPDYSYTYLTKKVHDFRRLYDLSWFEERRDLVGGVVGFPVQVNFLEEDAGERLKAVFSKYMPIIVRALKKLSGQIVIFVHLWGDKSLAKNKLHVHVHFVCKYQDKKRWMSMVRYLLKRGFGRVEARRVRSIFGYLLGYAGENTLHVLGVSEDFNFITKTKHGHYYVFTPEEAMIFTACLDAMWRRKLIRTINVPYSKRRVWDFVESRYEGGIIFVRRVREDTGVYTVQIVQYLFVIGIEEVKLTNLVLRKRKLKGVDIVERVKDGLGGDVERDDLQKIVDNFVDGLESKGMAYCV